MKSLKLGLFLMVCPLVFGQVSPGPIDSDKAPPEIDQALRARVNQFYSANVSGKWRDAFQVVADDMQDTFLAWPKDEFKSCEIHQITYVDNFTRANVMEICHGEYRWHASRIPSTVPLTSAWKIIDGQWFWYYVKPTEVVTPWGIARITPETMGEVPANKVSANIAAVTKDPFSMAHEILSMVKVDKDAVQLRSYETSKDEVHVKNSMPGQISLRIDPLPVPGLKITPGKTELGANEETTVVFLYDLEDASVLCGECAKRIRSTMTVQLHIEPTGQIFPITITFAIPPEMEKQLPKELQHPDKKQ
jgi:hypothetical protein